MGEYVFGCPTVPVIRGSEVRFSVDERRIVPIFDWPLTYESCGEIIPVQPRVQWGLPTYGARYDSYNGIRLGWRDYNLTLGFRSTNTSGEGKFDPAENQRVGVASLMLGGRVQFKYWNDHYFWWWPMGDGGDQGDTAGFQFNYNLAPHNLAIDDWQFSDFSLTMRLATGIPDRSSARPMGDGQVYTRVAFDDINRGDIDLSTRLSNGAAQNLTVGILVNADAVRHAAQDRLIHHTLGIPEFPRTGKLEVMMYLRLTDF